MAMALMVSALANFELRGATNTDKGVRARLYWIGDQVDHEKTLST